MFIFEKTRNMKTFLKYSFLLSLMMASFLLSNCKKKDTTLSDAEKVAALKNVSFIFNGMGLNITVPSAALTSGKTFDQLLAEDSATYSNPENYSIAFSANMTADNTKANAEDAKFDGMTVNIIMDTIKTYPVQTIAGAFELPKNTSLPVTAQGSINLKTHRLVGLYIFRQVVAGQDLTTTLSPILNYKIGALQGVINIPDIHQQIPTTASPEMKAFLSGLLNSAVFSSK
jgi:hypothetical protein